MTRAQALEVARQIDDRLKNMVCIERDPNGLSLAHLRWMIAEMGAMSEAKTMRWLGYIQGVLVAYHVFTLDECKEMSRKAAK